MPSPLTEDDLRITATIAEGHSVTEEELFRWCVEASGITYDER